MSDEVRVTNAATGGAKGSKPSQLATAPPHGLAVLGEVCGMGAEKYDPHNYRKGYDWSLSINALQRHVLAFLDGGDLDPESGLPHMAHAAWHCLVLVQFMRDYPEGDDRFHDPRARLIEPEFAEDPDIGKPFKGVYRPEVSVVDTQYDMFTRAGLLKRHAAEQRLAGFEGTKPTVLWEAQTAPDIEGRDVGDIARAGQAFADPREDI